MSGNSSSAENEDVILPVKKKDRDEFPALQRPIILVCNDFFAKCLWPLKEIMLSIKVNGPSQRDLLERAEYILKKEGFTDCDTSMV